jgi:uncharacterized membrane protein
MSADGLLFLLTMVAALGSGLVAGIFFAFSTFVMKALERITPASGIAAMQSINVAVINPLFLAVFLGTTTASVVLVLTAVWRWRAPGSEFMLLGGCFYLAGTFLVTLMFNVPRNEALALVESSTPSADAAWREYAAGWKMWNHVRTVAALAAAVYLTIALTQLRAVPDGGEQAGTVENKEQADEK